MELEEGHLCIRILHVNNIERVVFQAERNYAATPCVQPSATGGKQGT